MAIVITTVTITTATTTERGTGSQLQFISEPVSGDTGGWLESFLAYRSL